MSSFIRLAKIIKITLISLNATLLLSACGGGGGNTPLPPGADTKPPVILETVPSSEQIGVIPDKLIEIRFNEKIRRVSKNNIDFTLYSSNETTVNPQIKLAENPFYFDEVKNKLLIEPLQGQMEQGKVYQITILGIEDKALNPMEACTWIFATGGGAAPTINTGNTAVCGKKPPVGKPGNPVNVFASAGNGTVIITWQVPSSGGAPKTYKVEKSISTPSQFTIVEEFIPGNKFTSTDKSAENDTAHVYRVTAINDDGSSEAIESNKVTPGIPSTSTKPVEIITANIPVSRSRFGESFAISPDGLTLAVYHKKDAPTAGKKVGTVEISTKINNVWNYNTTVESKDSVESNTFGIKMVFSLDGNYLLIGDDRPVLTGATKPSSGYIEIFIFSKKRNSWLSSSRLSASSPATAIHFAKSIAISPDGKTLAVGTAKSVEIYTNSVTSNTAPVWFLESSFTSPTKVTNTNNFSYSLALSTDGTLLVVGNTSGDPTGFTDAGTVEIYNKINSVWQFTKTLNSTKPVAASFAFGKSVAISPDAKTLFVGNSGNISGSDTGNVEIFDNSSGSWKRLQVLPSSKATIGGRFGKSISLSSDGKTLAIAADFSNTGIILKTGNVELFHKIAGGSNWTSSQFIESQIPNSYNRFGVAIAFSLDGSVLIVGEYLGETKTSKSDVGLVNIFNTATFK